MTDPSDNNEPPVEILDETIQSIKDLQEIRYLRERAEQLEASSTMIQTRIEAGIKDIADMTVLAQKSPNPAMMISVEILTNQMMLANALGQLLTYASDDLKTEVKKLQKTREKQS